MSSTVQKTHFNFLTGLWFEMSIAKLDVFNQAIQAVNLPGFSIGNTILDNPFIKIPIAGDHMVFDNLVVQFAIDEEFKAYREIYDWAIQIGKPDELTQRPIDNKEVYSDGSIILFSSSKNAEMKIKIFDMIPIRVESLKLDYKDTDTNIITSTVTFSFRKYEIISLISI